MPRSRKKKGGVCCGCGERVVVCSTCKRDAKSYMSTKPHSDSDGDGDSSSSSSSSEYSSSSSSSGEDENMTRHAYRDNMLSNRRNRV